MIGDVACSQLTRVLFTSHNHNYILSCKRASRPIQARVLSQLFYNLATEPRAFTTAFSVDCLLPLTETYGFNNQNGGVNVPYCIHSKTNTNYAAKIPSTVQLLKTKKTSRVLIALSPPFSFSIWSKHVFIAVSYGGA